MTAGAGSNALVGAAVKQPPRLVVQRLSKRYGSIQALAEVDFTLQAGEVMALLGENGAGKSTLVKVLSGLVQADSGSIEIDGKPSELFPSARSQLAGLGAAVAVVSAVAVWSAGAGDIRHHPELWGTT